MAIEYRLTLAGSTPVEQVAERALPDPAERPTGTARLSADLYDRYGFDVTIRAGQNGYYDAESDNGTWEWEPETYVAVTFRMEKNTDSDRAVRNMLTVVRCVLDSGDEDAALIFNGDVLLFTRFSEDLVMHRRDGWWTRYAGAAGIAENSI
jgi:hypothetical protein